ncbi:MAG: hypothetical protein RLZZ200_1612 [Pseudomonadota bacterium]|jgi:UDP-glucose 4-epimerase
MSRHREWVLVTGGAGFIGSELCARLVRAGRRVVVLDNLVNGRRENLEGLSGDRLRLVVADVRDATRVASLLPDVSVVFHLACLGVRHSLHAPRETHDVNAGATLALLEASQQAGVGRFVYVSSSEVYGSARTVPMGESHPTHPSTIYGASKLAGEAYVRAWYATYGLPTVVVRPFNSFGPRSHHEGDAGEVIPKFMLRALAGRPLVVFGDGAQTRDFMEVGDTARGILLAGTVENAVGRTLNLGTGREIAITELARLIARIVERPDAPIVYDAERPADVRRLCADSTLARRLLGFEPMVTLEEGLTRLLGWYRRQEAPPEALLEAEVVRNWLPPVGSAQHGG